MLWPFRKRPLPEPCFSVGQYRIDTAIDELEGLTPLLPTELMALNAAVHFEGERIWHAPEADFLEMKWDTILGTVRNTIYKIAIQWTGPRDQTGKAYRDVLIYCTKHYGNGHNHMVWDTSDGNIVVDSRNIGSLGILNVFVTSRKVRDFKRL